MSRQFTSGSHRLHNTTDDFGITAYPFTIAMWIKFASNSADQNMWEFRNDSVGAKVFFSEIRANAKIRTHAVQSSSVNLDTAAAITASVNVWTPLIITYDTNEVKMYWDDVVATNTTSQTYVTNDTPFITIGKRTGNTAIDGKLAHITVWNIKLSGANIDSFEAKDDPVDIDSGNQTRYWAFTTSSLTDSKNSVVLTDVGTTYDASDNPLGGAGVFSGRQYPQGVERGIMRGVA